MVELIPRVLLFGNPERNNPKISKDGRYLSYLAPRDGVLNVWIAEVGYRLARPVTVSDTRPITDYRWSHDGRRILYLQDSDGSGNDHCYVVDIEAGTTRDLTPFDDVAVQLIATSPRLPDKILLGINRDDPELHDAYVADLAAGTIELVAKNPGFGVELGNWMADLDLNPRGGLRQRADGGVEVLHREGEIDWRVVHSLGPDNYHNFRPVGFTGDGRGVYLIDAPPGDDTAKLVKVDLKTSDLSVLAGDDRYDVTGAHLRPRTREVDFVEIYRDQLALLAVHSDAARDAEKLRAHDPGAELHLIDRDDADAIWLVSYVHDDAPTAYCAYDRRSGEILPLFEDRPGLRKYTLAKTEPYEFTSRDGLAVHGYVTFPAGVPRERLPTVIVVHGGPWDRDWWASRHEAQWEEGQWLANRGYLRARVNFRGSTGYGKDFVNASRREWAGKMHDDVVDAVDYVVRRGWADPSRVAIYGASYGGYAALVGASFTPDVFRCAVDIFGPSSLITLLENFPPYWKPWESVWHSHLGHPDRDRKFLWSRSPLSRVQDIRIPILIAQGANDPFVTRIESEQLVAALERNGVPHTYLLFEDEGHGFDQPENTMRLAREVERFLAEHIGGRFEP